MSEDSTTTATANPQETDTMSDTATYDAVEATQPKRLADFGNDFPEAAAKARNEGPILETLGYSRDRLDRLEHVLGDLNGVLMRLGHNLEPVLTDGSYDDPEPATVPESDEAYIDRRSTIARNITTLGRRADQLADAAGLIRDRVAAIDSALEL